MCIRDSYYNAVSRVEKHIAANRPAEWAELGKPSIFSGKWSDRHIRFQQLLEAGDLSGARDLRLTLLVDRSRRLKTLLLRVSWTAFGMYCLTIFAVRLLLTAQS